MAYRCLPASAPRELEVDDASSGAVWARASLSLSAPRPPGPGPRTLGRVHEDAGRDPLDILRCHRPSSLPLSVHPAHDLLFGKQPGGPLELRVLRDQAPDHVGPGRLELRLPAGLATIVNEVELAHRLALALHDLVRLPVDGIRLRAGGEV